MKGVGGRWVLRGIFALACTIVATLALSAAGFAAPPTLAGPVTAGEFRPQSTGVIQVQVICQRVRQGNQIITYSCPNGKACAQNAQGTWICKAPVTYMSCSVCYNNQKRDSDACTRSGTLMQQSDCVNRVNRELNQCLGHCQ